MAATEETTLRLEQFKGICEGIDDHQLNFSLSPDCVNIDTREGNMARAMGFEKVTDIDSPQAICSLYAHYPQSGGNYLVHAATRKGVYRHDLTDGIQSWQLIGGSATNVREGTRYSFATLRQGIDQNIDEVMFIACDDPDYPLAYISGGQLKRTFQGTAPNAAYLCVCKERIWAAGDPENPQRIYYSRAFAGQDWRGLQVGELPDSAAGFIDLPTEKSQPIVGICRSMDAVFIFTPSSVWTVLGEVPSNFHLVQRSGSYGAVNHQSIAEFGGAVYFIDRSGLCYFDGVSAKKHPDAQLFEKTFKRLARNSEKPPKYRLRTAGEMLYLGIGFDDEHGDMPVVVEYDAVRRCAMLRHGIDLSNGFLAEEMDYTYGNADTVKKSRVCFSDTRNIYRYGQGETYNGVPIAAWWRTPWWDGRQKGSEKQLQSMACYAKGDTDRGLTIDMYYDAYHSVRQMNLPENERLIDRALWGNGRRIALQISNQDGGYFKLRGGVEIGLEIDPL